MAEDASDRRREARSATRTGDAESVGAIGDGRRRAEGVGAAARARVAASARWLRKVPAKIADAGALVTTLGALASLVALVLAAVFAIWPQLRPESEPGAMAATLSNPKVERGVTLGDYWDRERARIARQAPKVRDFTEAERRHPGVVVSFQAVIEGYQGRRCLVWWSLFDAETQARLPADSIYVDQYGWPDKYITPTAPRDQIDAEIWIPLPPDPGTYFARLELHDPDGIRLASLDTGSFAGGASPPSSTTPPRPTVVLTPPSLGSSAHARGGHLG